jgi:serine/threonine protein kinase
MLGEGSYGRIYICYYEDEEKQRIYKLALKIVSIPNNIREIKKIEEIVAFTRQEVKSLIRLRHNPNIIKIEDVIGDTKNHRIYIILEYCNNKDLDSYFRQLYAKKKIRREEDILKYFSQILNAFRDLYKCNIIHRDIKP